MQRRNRLRRHHFRHPRRGIAARSLLAFLVLVAGIGGGAYLYFDSSEELAFDPDSLITQVASRGPFDHIVLEQGEIESSRNTEVVCEVKSRDGSVILWVIDEGARVKAGEKLVELDQSNLDIRLKEQKIEVITAQADVTTAEALVEQAKIARQEYLEGVYKTEEKAILSEIAIAEQNLRKAKLAIESSQRLVAKGLVKSLQLEADRFAVANALNQKEADEGRLSVLRELTRRKMLVQFDSDIESAEARLSAARSELLEEQNELAEVEEQIENCIIYAPTDGIVVHANRFSSRGGSEFVVEAGATVRERQAIIRLPDPSQMQVKCNVNESRVTLISPGMAARITIGALPGLELTGRVRKVNRYSEPGSWYSSSIKEYASFIEILDPPELIRTGMTAEVQIFVQQLDDALQIPIEGLYEHDGAMYSLVRQGEDQFKTVEVKMGATNDTMASIDSGLSESDQVVLNLRQHLSLMDLPEISGDDNSDIRKVVGRMNRDNPLVATAQPGAAGKESRAGQRGDQPSSSKSSADGGRSRNPNAARSKGGGKPRGDRSRPAAQNSSPAKDQTASKDQTVTKDRLGATDRAAEDDPAATQDSTAVVDAVRTSKKTAVGSRG